MKRFLVATLTILLVGLSFARGTTIAVGMTPSGERLNGQVSIEPAYDDSTGNPVYLATPAQLAPLVYEELRLCAVRYTQPLARRANRRPSISRAKDRRRLLPSRL